MVIGSFGLYFEGLSPSMTPPWEGALAVEEGVAEPVTVVVTVLTSDAVTVDAMFGKELFVATRPARE